jgi:SAM-dependent methyltransferase
MTTVRIAWHELVFDWRFGTETKEYVELDSITADSIHKADGHRYGPLQVPFFDEVFGENGPIRDRTCFIDIGCGKGRPLLLAALAGFKRVIGVEYDKGLCDTARENITAFQARTASKARFEVIQEDAVVYPLPEQEPTTVCIFYNPFEPAILDKVIRSIEASFARAPREIFVVYFACSDGHRQVLSRLPHVKDFPAAGTAIYRIADSGLALDNPG